MIRDVGNYASIQESNAYREKIIALFLDNIIFAY